MRLIRKRAKSFIENEPNKTFEYLYLEFHYPFAMNQRCVIDHNVVGWMDGFMDDVGQQLSKPYKAL